MKLLPLVALISSIAAASAEEAPFYIGSTGSPADTQGIYRVLLDLDSGKVSAPQKVAEARGASWLSIHPSGEYLYATSEGSPGKVASFAIAEDGTLKPLNLQSTGGAGPTHLWIDSAGKNLLVANYTGGSVASLPIREDGTLGELTSFVQHTGSSVDPDRQKEPHAHGIYADADDKFVYVPDLGTDLVVIYKFDAEKGKLTPNTPPAGKVKPGSGPRHFAFQPGSGFAYVINEMFSTITSFKHDGETGALEPLDTISTLPADFKGNNTTAEIAFHPNGRFLYGSNRGHDSIALFSVDAESGKLTLVQHTPTGGKTPRNFTIDPTGKWLVAANQDSGDFFVFRIDPATGKLTATGNKGTLNRPMSIAFPPR